MLRNTVETEGGAELAHERLNNYNRGNGPASFPHGGASIPPERTLTRACFISRQRTGTDKRQVLRLAA